MINKLIDKYGTLLNILRDNKSAKSAKSKTDTYDYNTDIKNTREYLKDLKALKQQLTIPVVGNCTDCNAEINYKGLCEVCHTEYMLKD